ncbi:MAG: N-succinylarginine dihydrolase [Polyangiaceae bacterium]
MREYDFDGLVGPTHNYGGLAVGNVASARHEGQLSNPRAAALQGLDKMRFVRELGVAQAVLPPHPRPHLPTLHALGFRGSDEEMMAAAAGAEAPLLRVCSSASAMWAANAATVAPSSDTADGRLHLVPANLDAMFHRAIEAPVTHAVLSTIFADPARFTVHRPLPGARHFGDEGAANHARLAVPDAPAVHLFGWGRRSWEGGEAASDGSGRHAPRQAREASEAVARLLQLDPARCVFARQHPRGIEGGAFHTDVLAVANEGVLLVHELAFDDVAAVEAELRARLGLALRVELAREAELPLADAVDAYPFNSQLLTLPSGEMAVVAPTDARHNPAARRFLERVVGSGGPVRAVHWLDVRESMRNGGGPACLRLRVPLEEAEVAALGARVVLDEALEAELRAWVTRHYRDRLLPADLADPVLAREALRAIDELSAILQLGSVFAFQR